MKLKIYLFRHGQTYFNKNKYFTGWKDSKLTSVGVKNAKSIGLQLKGKQIDVAFRSSLSRSKDTLKYVLDHHPECRKVFVDDRMIERSYGDFAGKKHSTIISELGKDLFDKYHRSYDFPPPNGESLKMVEKRVNDFIKFLLKYMRENKVNVAISAHGNSMRPFRKYFEKLSLAEMISLENPQDVYFEYEVEF